MLLLISFVPILMAYYFGIIPLWPLLTIIYFIYWIPKIIVLDLIIESYFPSIITRNKSILANNIAITIDDMPYGDAEAIIDLFDKYEFKGTFFVISDFINENNKDIFVKAVKNGHTLGNHGKTNSNHLIKLLSEDKYRCYFTDEVLDCDKKIAEIYKEAGVPLGKKLYRPGCGLFNNDMISRVERLGYKICLGSVYPNDPLVMSPQINYFYLLSKIEKGDIVILHDRRWTLPLLSKLFSWMQLSNMRSVTVSDLFRKSE